MKIQTSRQFLAKLAANRRLRVVKLLSPAMAVSATLVAGNLAYATDYTKDDNTTALSTSGSYTITGTPTAKTDRVIFDATISAANEASLTTASLTLGSFVFQTLNGPVGISLNSGSTVTLGGNGGDIIDMTAATQDVTFGGSGTLRLGTLSGTQNFDVAAGRTLTIGVGNITSQGNSDTLGLIGAGNIVVNTSVNASSSPLGLSIAGANVTLNGSNVWSPNSTTTFALTTGTLNFGNDNAIQTTTGNTKQFTISGGTITASGAAHAVATNGGFLFSGSFAVGGANNLTLSSNVSNSGSNTITNSNTGTFTLSGNIDLTNSGATNRVLTLTGAGATTLSGVVSNGTSTGLGSLTYSGTGTLTLSGANTYGGATSGGNTIINSGTVKIGNASALGVGRVAVGNSGTLDLNGSNLNVPFIENTTALGTGVIDNVSAGGNVTLTVGGGAGGETGTSSTYTTIGSFSGAIKNTTGTVNLTKIAPTAGTGAAIIATASRLQGAAVLTLNGTNTYTGSTAIKGGFLQLLPQSTTGVISSSSPLILQGGGLIVDIPSGTVTQTFNGTTLNAGGASVGAYRPASTSLTLNLGAITRNIGSTVSFQDRPNSSSSNGTLGAGEGTDTTTTGNASFTGGSATIFGGYATYGGSSWAVAGTGTNKPLSALATASYSTTLAAGTNVDLQTTGNASGGALTINSLRALNATATTTNAYALTLGGDLTVATGGILVAATNTNAVANASISGNFNLTSGNGQDLIFITNNLALGTGVTTMTVSSNITDNGATSIGLTKSGLGTLTLAPATANTFTGQLTINAGSVVLGAANALNGNNVVFGGSNEIHGGGSGATGAQIIQANGTLVLNGNSVTVGSLTSSTDSTGTASVQNANATAATLTLNGAASTTYTGLLQDGTGGGALSLAKSGTGTQTLTNNLSSYTGAVNISGGILAASASNNSTNPATSALGNPQVARSINVNNGGTLRFDAGDTFGGAASTVVSTLVINAGGTVTNNGSSYTTLGPVTLNGGTLTGNGGSGNTQFQMYGFGGDVTVAGSTASTISGSGTTSGFHLGTSVPGRTGTAFTVADSTGDLTPDLNVSATLIDRTAGSGAATLTKVGAGTMALTAANAYTGGTTINAGVLLANNAAGSATGTGAVAVNAGTLGGTGTMSGTVTVASGATLLGGTGLTASGALTLSANPTLGSGSIIELVLGASGAHSAINLAAGGFNGFNANQAFTLDSTQAGTYDNIITGVASGIDTTNWVVTNASGLTYSFTDDGANIDLSVISNVPEPSTYLGGALLVGVAGWSLRRRSTVGKSAAAI